MEENDNERAVLISDKNDDCYCFVQIHIKLTISRLRWSNTSSQEWKSPDDVFWESLELTDFDRPESFIVSSVAIIDFIVDGVESWSANVLTVFEPEIQYFLLSSSMNKFMKQR